MPSDRIDDVDRTHRLREYLNVSPRGTRHDALLLSSTCLVSAQSQPEAEEVALSELSVTGTGPAVERAGGPVVGYRATRSATATRTDTPLRDTPQSVQVVPRDVLVDQQDIRLSDALQNVSSVQPGGTIQGRSDTFIIRGFRTQTYAIDGVLLNQASNFSAVTRDLADVERIEVLKGPASVLYGRGDPGGLINIVTRQPTLVAVRRHQPAGRQLRLPAGAGLGVERDRGRRGPVRARSASPAQSDPTFRNFGGRDNARTFVAPAFAWNPTPGHAGHVPRRVHPGGQPVRRGPHRPERPRAARQRRALLRGAVLPLQRHAPISACSRSSTTSTPTSPCARCSTRSGAGSTPWRPAPPASPTATPGDPARDRVLLDLRGRRQPDRDGGQVRPAGLPAHGAGRGRVHQRLPARLHDAEHQLPVGELPRPGPGAADRRAPVPVGPQAEERAERPLRAGPDRSRLRPATARRRPLRHGHAVLFQPRPDLAHDPARPAIVGHLAAGRPDLPAGGAADALCELHDLVQAADRQRLQRRQPASGDRRALRDRQPARSHTRT